ncbi:MAG: response regulator [Cryobacterium sp.]|nr:response regulator [Oligoflexia bacterium]
MKRILVMDDTPTMRMIVTGMLNDLGFRDVLEAENTEMALSLMGNYPIAIILADWNLPGKSGIEFLRQIRAVPATRDLPVVMMTSNNDPSQIEEARRAGVSSYLVKPFGADDLLARLEEASLAHVKDEKSQ